MAYIYIVRCADDSLYTGITKDLGRRMREHDSRKKPCARYTRSRRIVSLQMVWETDTWSGAASLENHIKRLTKKEKEALIRKPDEVDRLFAGRLKGSYYRPLPGMRLEQFVQASDDGQKARE